MLFFLLASPWFILADLALFAILVALTETEHGIFAGVALALATVAGIFFSGGAVIPWIIANPGTILTGAAIYLVIGILWAIAKWFFYTRKDETQDIFKDYYRSWKLAEESKANQREAFGDLFDPKNNTYHATYEAKTFEEYLKERSHSNPLDPSKNKIRITRWMIWWPTSFVWTLLSDLVINIFNFIYDKIAFIFTSILNAQINRAIRDVEKG